jgi:hypothetical protein
MTFVISFILQPYDNFHDLTNRANPPSVTFREKINLRDSHVNPSIITTVGAGGINFIVVTIRIESRDFTFTPAKVANHMRGDKALTTTNGAINRALTRINRNFIRVCDCHFISLLNIIQVYH